MYGKNTRDLVKYDVGALGAKDNDSLSEKLAIVKFYTMEYRKCGNFNLKNDSRPCMGASAIPKSVDFWAFAVNVKTIAPSQKLYQSGHAIWNADLPMPLYSFLEEYDFSGKTIIPFYHTWRKRIFKDHSDHCRAAAGRRGHLRRAFHFPEQRIGSRERCYRLGERAWP